MKRSIMPSLTVLMAFQRAMASCRSAPVLCTVLTLATATLSHAGWIWEVNGYGCGEITANVTSGATGIQNSGTDRGCFASVAIPPPAGGGFDVTGPLPAGANPATFVQAQLGIAWRHPTHAFAAGGDTDDEADLLPFVTPVSYESSTSIDGTATIVSSTLVMFQITWMGSDQGTAQRLSFYELPPSEAGDPLSFTGDLTGATLLDSVLKVGPWSETDDYSITLSNPGDLDPRAILVVTSEGIATSIPSPEPAPVMLLGIGLLGLAGWARFKHEGGRTQGGFSRE